MKLLSLALLAAANSVVAQNSTFLDGLMSTLEHAGCTSLTQLASSLNSTSQGQYLLKTISNGDPYVLFAPNDTAVSNAPSNLTSNPADLLSYHVVHGNFSGQSTTYPNTTVGRTFLNDTTYVSLEGNKSQVVAWATRSDGNVHVLNQRSDSSSMVTNVTSYGNVTIYVVSSVLEWPDNFSGALSADTPYLDGLGATISNVTQSFYNGTDGSTSNETVARIIDGGFKGFTLFAPNTSAIEALGGGITQYEQNATLLQIILANHIINGTSVYSPELVGQDYTSAAGEQFSFSINSTGQYVKMGSVTARIIQPDVLLSNGVAHIIDQVLLNTEEDTSAASSAAASATSMAAQSTTETRPIGYSQTASLASGGASGSSASGSSSSSSAALAVGGLSASQIVGLGFTAVALIVGAFVVIA
ncbi:FAS1 domain-containing protein [Rhodofomes roseus]|uniref:FAS1 domain-containing protein n=1 Tax=Rhodofomes roseus TaxID=34475 RepID=A0ABQ8KHJ8_9APHY|nr:FAS1 domain-containing protein [Rhodofomes roseus]KAH9836808.1 FAS1 domain-containing protein [Rhodofomes roseus]